MVFFFGIFLNSYRYYIRGILQDLSTMNEDFYKTYPPWKVIIKKNQWLPYIPHRYFYNIQQFHRLTCVWNSPGASHHSHDSKRKLWEFRNQLRRVQPSRSSYPGLILHSPFSFLSWLCRKNQSYYVRKTRSSLALLSIQQWSRLPSVLRNWRQKITRKQSTYKFGTPTTSIDAPCEGEGMA